ncbi:hypothetical protein [Mesorhizobium sp. SARCC-RB16n]|nr:hypothetical protein [Mesorhizobium sp. SARCC-RB16n]
MVSFFRMAPNLAPERACTASGLAIVIRLQSHVGLIDLNAVDHNLLGG